MISTPRSSTFWPRQQSLQAVESPMTPPPSTSTGAEVSHLNGRQGMHCENKSSEKQQSETESFVSRAIAIHRKGIYIVLPKSSQDFYLVQIRSNKYTLQGLTQPISTASSLVTKAISFLFYKGCPMTRGRPPTQLLTHSATA